MENKLPVRFKNLTLDLEHPESGIETIKNLTKIYEKEKEEYKKALFNWTEQEIEDAKLIAIDRMNMLCRRGVSIVWYCNKVHGITMLSTNFGTVEGVECGCKPYHGRDVRTKVHGKDVYNPWIGKCVCLCKFFNEPIPKFILNKNCATNS